MGYSNMISDKCDHYTAYIFGQIFNGRLSYLKLEIDGEVISEAGKWQNVTEKVHCTSLMNGHNSKVTAYAQYYTLLKDLM